MDIDWLTWANFAIQFVWPRLTLFDLCDARFRSEYLSTGRDFFCDVQTGCSLSPLCIHSECKSWKGFVFLFFWWDIRQGGRVVAETGSCHGRQLAWHSIYSLGLS